MTQPAVPDSADWQRRWTVDAGSVTLRPVTRRLARDVLDGGRSRPRLRRDSCTRGSRRPWALPSTTSTPARPPSCRLSGSSSAAPMDGFSAIWGPTARLTTKAASRSATASAPSARGQGIGTAAVAAFVRRLAEEPGIRRLTAVTGAQNTASQRLLERQGFHLTGPLSGHR